MNRHQRKVLSLAAAIANLSLSVAVASVATYAWFTSNTQVSASTLTISAASVDFNLGWEVLRYDDDIKAGKSFGTDADEFYLQDYDVYITQKNKYANALLFATIDFSDSYTIDKQMYIDITCQPDHDPVYGSACPAYTSNVCQFKALAYSYTLVGSTTPQPLNTSIDLTNGATKYSTVSNWFASSISQYEKFVSVINGTSYKRSNTICVTPDMNDLYAHVTGSQRISQLVIFIEISYNPELVDYYVETNSDSLGEQFSLAADITELQVRLGDGYAGSYVKMTSGTLTDGQYLIVNNNYNVALDGSLESFTGKNYLDVHPIKNRIKKTEITKAAEFTYDATNKTFTSDSGAVIGFNGASIDVNETYVHQSASVASGKANIVYSSNNYLSFDDTENVTKFNYGADGTYKNISIYQYVSSQETNVYVSSIAITTPTTDLTFNRYDLFKHTGLVVTVTYNNNETDIVTNDCIFSIGGQTYTSTTPVAVTGSQTVTITYYDPDNSNYYATKTYGITIYNQTIALSSETLEGVAGNSTTLTATVSHFSGTPSYQWSSNNSSIVMVSGDTATANVTYISEGNATITCRATLGSQTAVVTCEVDVEAGIPVTGITVSPTSVIVYINESTTLAATVRPASATNQNVIWYSGNTGVVTVSNTGVLTGVAVGSTIVYAYSDTNGNGQHEFQVEPYGQCTVEVKSRSLNNNVPLFTQNYTKVLSWNVKDAQIKMQKGDVR